MPFLESSSLCIIYTLIQPRVLMNTLNIVHICVSDLDKDKSLVKAGCENSDTYIHHVNYGHMLEAK